MYATLHVSKRNMIDSLIDMYTRSIDVFVNVFRTVNTTLRDHSAADVDLVTMATHKLVLRRTVSLVRVL